MQSTTKMIKGTYLGDIAEREYHLIQSLLGGFSETGSSTARIVQFKISDCMDDSGDEASMVKNVEQLLCGSHIGRHINIVR